MNCWRDLVSRTARQCQHQWLLDCQASMQGRFCRLQIMSSTWLLWEVCTTWPAGQDQILLFLSLNCQGLFHLLAMHMWSILVAAKHLLRYLNGTKESVGSIPSLVTLDPWIQLISCGARLLPIHDWVGCPDSLRSKLEYVFKLNGAAV